MTDLPNPIPEALIAEACRRLNKECAAWPTDTKWVPRDVGHPVVIAMCCTLHEFGWRPPVDPDLEEAREIVAKWEDSVGCPALARDTREGMRDHTPMVQQTLAGIKRGKELGRGV